MEIDVDEEEHSGWTIDTEGNRLLFGIGFLGEGFYKAIRFKKYVIEYSTWYLMMKRCYCPKHHKIAPSYIGCSVSEEWHNFQNFASWYCRQKQYGQKGWELDKDILTQGNKVYSPENCCLLPKSINSTVAISRSTNSGLPVGIGIQNSKKNPYRVKLHGAHVGMYPTVEQAYTVYKSLKEEAVKEIASKWKDKLDVNVFEALMTWKVDLAK